MGKVRMLFIFSVLRILAPFAIWFALWTLGLLFLYPLWFLSVTYPSLFLGLVEVLLGGLFLWFLTRFFKGKNLRGIFMLGIWILKRILILFTLILSLVAFSSVLWWQALLSLIFFFMLVYVKIPNGAKRL